MTKQQSRTALKRATAFATQQHRPVRDYLWDYHASALMERVAVDPEKTILRELLKNKKPVPGKRLIEMTGLSKVGLSDAAKRLNGILFTFFENREPFKSKHIIPQLPRFKGRAQPGYHFALQDVKKKAEYLDGPATKDFFANFWKYQVEIELRKSLAEEIQLFHLRQRHDHEDVYIDLCMEVGKVEKGQLLKLDDHAGAHSAISHNSRSWSDFDPKSLIDMSDTYILSSITGTDKTTFLRNLQQEIRSAISNHSRTWNDFDPKLLIDMSDTYILSSDTGTGKTTFLRNLQQEILDDGRRIAILRDATEVKDWSCETIGGFVSCLAESLGLQVPRERLIEYLIGIIDSKIILFIDGLDQIDGAGYERVLQKVVPLCTQHDIPILFASRPTAVVKEENNDKITLLRLKPFGLSDRREYFGNNYDRAQELCRHNPDMLGIPMLAYMVKMLIDEGKDQHIHNRASLYERFIDHILYVHTSAAPIGEREAAKEFLQRVSYEAFVRAAPYIQKIPLTFCLKFMPKNRDIDSFLKLGLVSLVVERSSGIERYLYFTHQSFQEYLAACELAIKSNWLDVALSRVCDSDWKESLIMLVGILYNPGSYISTILHANRNDDLYRPLPVALRATAEVGRHGVPGKLLMSLARIGVSICLNESLNFVADDVIAAMRHLPGSVIAICELGVTDRTIEFLKKMGTEEAIAALGNILASEDHVRRIQAIKALSGIRSSVSISALIGALCDKDVEIRKSAAEALLRMRSEESIPALVDALDDAAASVRKSCVRCLGEIGSEKAVPALIRALQDDDALVRSSSAEALGQIGSEEAVKPLISSLQDEWFGMRLQSVLALAHISSKESLPGLVNALKENTDSVVRKVAADTLGIICSEQAAPALIRAVREDQNAYVRWWSAKALEEIGWQQAVPAWIQALLQGKAERYWSRGMDSRKSESEQTVSVLVCAMQDEDPDVRRIAANVIREMRSDDCVPALIGILQRESDESRVRMDVAELLGDIGSEQSVPVLIQLLQKDDNANVRWCSIKALEKIGSEEAVTALMESLLGDEDAGVRSCSGGALGKIGSEQSVAALIEALESDKDCRVRFYVAHALGCNGWKQSLPALIKALGQEEDAHLRSKYADVLGQIGSERAVQALIHGLQEDGDANVQVACTDALGHIGSKQSVPALVKALEESMIDGVRRQAAKILGQISSRQSESALIQALLQDRDPGVRRISASAMEKVDVSKSIQALTKALRDGDPSVRMTSADMLRRISPKRPVKHRIKHGEDEPLKGTSTNETERSLQSLAMSLEHLGSLFEKM